MILNKEIISIFKTDKELFEKYKTFIPSITEGDFSKITIILENNVPSNDTGPAIIVETPTEIIKSWIIKGFYHRLYGPAIEYKIHSKNNKWIINGILINSEDILNWAQENNIDDDYTQWNTRDKAKFLLRWKNN